jgi:hypothetical protein
MASAPESQSVRTSDVHHDASATDLQPTVHEHVQPMPPTNRQQHRALALTGVRSWLCISPDGSCKTVQLERQVLERELGVQLRDFRVLDVVLGSSYPACILVR